MNQQGAQVLVAPLANAKQPRLPAGRVLADSNPAIDAMVADIDAAKRHVHLLFYIWLQDGNGCKIVEALKRVESLTLRARPAGR